jgi:hypothetical protein
MTLTFDKLNRLFKDINQYYSEYGGYRFDNGIYDGHSLEIWEFNKWIKENKTVFYFFEQAFEAREFNVKVTDNYLNKIFEEYDLSFDEIEKYCEKIKINEKERKRKEKKLRAITIVSILVMLVLGFGYSWYVERQDEIKEQLRLEKLAEENQRDIKIKSLIKEYINQTDNRNVKQILSYWSNQPIRYWNINKNNELGFISKSKIEESISKAFNINSFSENKIRRISKIDNGIYEVDVAFKFKSKKTGIVKEVQSSTIIWFNDDDKIIQEYGKGEPVTVFDSSTKYTKTYTNGYYEGTLRDELKEGYGEFYYNNGNFYEGEFLDDKIYGKGKTTFKNGDSFEGNYENGVRNGFGKYNWVDGGSYEGNWENDKIYGKGKMTFRNGDIYEGNWENGKRSGKGKMTFRNGDIYEGNWENGKRSGKGIETLNDGTSIEQEWRIFDNISVLIDRARRERYEKTFSKRALILENPLTSSKTVYIAVPGDLIETIDDILYNGSFRKVRFGGFEGYIQEILLK